jgi:hypothetical protein
MAPWPVLTCTTNGQTPDRHGKWKFFSPVSVAMPHGNAAHMAKAAQQIDKAAIDLPNKVITRFSKKPGRTLRRPGGPSR